MFTNSPYQYISQSLGLDSLWPLLRKTKVSFLVWNILQPVQSNNMKCTTLFKLSICKMNDIRWHWNWYSSLQNRNYNWAAAVTYLEGGDAWSLPCGSAFLKAFPASMKLVAASCLLCIWRWRRAAWENAFPAAEEKTFHVRRIEVGPKLGKRFQPVIIILTTPVFGHFEHVGSPHINVAGLFQLGWTPVWQHTFS